MRALSQCSVRLFCALVVLLLSSAAFAIEPAGGSPEATEKPVELEEEETSAQVDAPGRSWLKSEAVSEEDKTVEQPESTNVSGIWAVLVVAILAGAAVYLRFRRGEGPILKPRSNISVISTTKIGPKASLVATRVDGRVLLLGVTETNVSELGWIGDAEADVDTSSAEQEELPESEPASFDGVLSSVMGRGRRAQFEGNPNVAAMLVEGTEDVVTLPRSTSRRPSRRAVEPTRSETSTPQQQSRASRLEDQVAGLARLRR